MEGVVHSEMAGTRRGRRGLGTDVTGALVLLGTLAVAAGLGLVLHARSGRVRTTPVTEPLPPGVATALDVPTDSSARVVLLQLSSRTCAPCRTTGRLLRDVARADPGVVHVEVDAAAHLPQAEALSVVRTPTVLVLDGAGGVRARWSGVVRRPELDAALAAVT